MRIQYFSDLHLEFYSLAKFYKLINRIQPISPICVLAGDIGYPFHKTYELFLTQISKKFEHVILIHGNHEYYRDPNKITLKPYTIADNITRTQQIIQNNMLANIHFLNNTYVDLFGHRFVGSTMWSNIVDPQYLINDATYIPEFTVERNNAMHAAAKEFIHNTIADSPNPVIVVSHHLPLNELVDPKYAKYAKYNQCFASDCSDVIGANSAKIRTWIYGHTHSVSDQTVNSVRFFANPIGYPGENAGIDFSKMVEI